MRMCHDQQRRSYGRFSSLLTVQKRAKLKSRLQRRSWAVIQNLWHSQCLPKRTPPSRMAVVAASSSALHRCPQGFVRATRRNDHQLVTRPTHLDKWIALESCRAGIPPHTHESSLSGVVMTMLGNGCGTDPTPGAPGHQRSFTDQKPGDLRPAQECSRQSAPVNRRVRYS